MMNNRTNWMFWGVMLLGAVVSGCGGGSGSPSNDSDTLQPQLQGDGGAEVQLRAVVPVDDITRELTEASGQLLGFVVMNDIQRVPLSIEEDGAVAEFNLAVGHYHIFVVFEFFDDLRSTTWRLAQSPSQEVDIVAGPNRALSFQAINYDTAFDDDDDGFNNLTELENGTDPGTPDIISVENAVIDALGNPLTVVDPYDPVTIRVPGLTPNTPYTVNVVDPNGIDHNPDGGFLATTDEDGLLHDFTVVQNLDMSNVVDQAFAQEGPHRVELIERQGSEVTFRTIDFDVEDSHRVFCMDENSIPRASFLPGENVFARIALDDGTYNVYVISDLNPVLDNEDVLVGNSFSVDVVEEIATLSLGSYASGSFDVVVDVNGNGLFDQNVDLISRHRRLHACFAIQTERVEDEEGFDEQGITTQLCTDRSGNPRNVFDPNTGHAEIRDMFAFSSAAVRSLISETPGVDKYIVSHRDAWRQGDPLEDVTGNVEISPAQHVSMRDAPSLAWPRQSMQDGCYDVIIDVNRNGVFDVGTDFVDNIDTLGNTTCGCQVALPTCASDVIISNVGDGEVILSSAMELVGTVAGQPIDPGLVEIVSGLQATTVTVTPDGNGFSVRFPLFNGRNLVTTSFFYEGGSIACSNTLAVTSAPVNVTGDLLRLQLTWDGDTDMDLHLVRPEGDYDNGASNGSNDDCNFSNCQGSPNSIDWGELEVESDDPVLDVDCVACGTGIENIRMSEINEDGLYAIYVDAFSGTETDVTVTVFIRGAEVGEVNCGDMAAGTVTDSCLVGTVEWRGGSTGNGFFTPFGDKDFDFPTEGQRAQ